MRIVFFGTPLFAVPTLKSLLEHRDLEIIAVVTQPDKRRGRGNQMTPSPIKQIALEHNLPVWQPKRVKKATNTLSLLKQSSADAFVVVAYGQILSPEILAMPRLGCINVHGSILPKYRGAAPIQWCIYHGESKTGVTTMLMDEGMDTGAMLLKTFTPIDLLENAYQVAERLAQQGSEILIKTLFQFDRGEITPIPQNEAQATYAPLIQKSDYQIDWDRSSLEIHNQVRGFYPNAVTRFREQSLKVLATAPLGEQYWSQLPPELQILSSVIGHPGEVVMTLKNLGAVIQTGNGLLLLTQVQLAGKRPQSGRDFVNGMRLEVGERLN